MSSNDGTLGVAMIGHSFMGAAHSQAWRTAGRFFDLPLIPRMEVVVGRHAVRAQRAADQLGWAGSSTDLDEVLARDDIHLVDVCTPGHSHADVAIAALRAGKHVLCEKPLANTVSEAEAMVEAAEQARGAGVRAMVGFNYRRVPALAFARQLVSSGRLGTIRHVRAAYLQDWLVDPDEPLSWRLDRDLAGSGALGDLGAHIVDAARFVTDERLASVSGATETFITERPVAASSAGLSAQAGEGRGQVSVDDAAVFLGRLDGGGLATFEATRFATGHKNGMSLEVNGSDGSLRFSFESMNELWFFDGREPSDTAGFRRVLVTESEHPYIEAWWPPGHVLGYEHTFTHEVADLVADIAASRDPQPSFADGLYVQRVLGAVEDSAAASGAQVSVQP